MPGVVAYLEIGLMTDLGWLSPLSFLVGVVALALHAIFWITFTIMLGSFFDAWAPVIGIPLALAFGHRAIPLTWRVLPFGGTGAELQLTLLKEIQPLLPKPEHHESELCRISISNHIIFLCLKKVYEDYKVHQMHLEV